MIGETALETTSYSHIPEELKSLRQWVCYRIEERDGTPTKIPYRTDKAGRGNARTNNPGTWHTFDEVVEAAAKPKNRFSGIGFVLSESDPYVFIDLDHVVSEGEIEPWAEQLVERIGSYTELSRSGSGIHIIARANKPGPRCRTAKHPKFEIYADRRLVVFTGKTLPGTPDAICDAEEAVAEVYRYVFGDNPENTPPKETVKNAKPVGMSDPVLIEKALSASNGEKFARLWHGNIGDYNGDASAADMALCCMLAYWTDKDPVRIDRLFRESGLMRDKWDERRGHQTYGEITIEAANTKTEKTYSGHMGGRRGKSASNGGVPGGSDPGNAFDASLPTIYADCQDLRVVTTPCWTAIVLANENPRFFRYMGTPSRLEWDDDENLAARELTQDRLRHELARVANWVSGKDAEPAKPPLDVVRDILATPNPPLPVLQRITDVPVFAPDASLSTDPGYHAAGHTYLMPRKGLAIPDIPESPAHEDVEAAKDLILGMIRQFPFVEEADRAHAVALLILPFVRDLIEGATPNHMVEAPLPGSGKGLLADVLLIPACGRHIPSITEAGEDDEWRKRITAHLRAARTAILIDNITRPLNSGSLASALTQTLWEDRILGKSENQYFPIRCVWVTTANNPQMTTEIARRCVRIRLDAQVDRPWCRTGFDEKDLRTWAHSHRGELIGAALTLAQSWIAAGMPPPDVSPLGSYERWTTVIGGILQHAGIAGFLENLMNFYEAADVEGETWRQMVEAWWEKFGSEKVGANQLFELALEIDSLDLGKGGERSQKTTFGRRLAKQRDRVIGGRRIVTAGKSRRASQWMLVPTSQMTLDEVNIVNIGEPFSPLPHACTHTRTPACASMDEGENVHQGSPCSPDEQLSDSKPGDISSASDTTVPSPGYEEF